MPYFNLPRTPLYDPKSKIMNFRFDEDFETIRMNLSGTGGLFHDTTFTYVYNPDQEWMRPEEFCRNPKFINGQPERFDALQGEIGNCWFLAAVEALTFNDQLIQHVVPRDQSFGYDYIGAFHFRIWQLGLWYDVVVDDRLPVYRTTKKLCYAHSRTGEVFWAALLEKAYAKVYDMNADSYDSINYGRCVTSLQDLTGGLVEMRRTRGIPSEDLKWVLGEVYKSNALMVGSCDKKQGGFNDNHSYAVTNIWKTAQNDSDYNGLCLIRLMNPWGKGEWKGDWSDDDYNLWKQIDQDIRKRLHVIKREDGEFWIDEKTFSKYFRYFCVCHLGPGQYMSIRDGQDFRTWRTSSFNGEWVKGESAVGEDLSERHKNPQYRVQLDWPQNSVNKDGGCTVVIELTQRSKQGRLVTPEITCYVYNLPIADNVPVPLSHSFFLSNDPVDKYPTFSENSRCYVNSMQLYCPGKYCIIPCTMKNDIESQFLLRVFSESTTEIWEYDTQISKSLPKEERSLSHFDEDLKRLFDDASRGQGEIDWIGLKEILDAAINPETGIFSRLISSLVKFVGDIFQNMFTLRLSNNSEAVDMVFSKDECRSMIAMLDDNHSGKLNFSEFTNLWSKICFWAKVYENHRDETEGYVAVSRLRDALSSIGYVVNKRTVHSLSYVYANEQGNISLTDFILCGVTIETVLALRERKYEGSADKMTFTLEGWVKNTLIL